MSKKNKNKKSINADSIDVDSINNLDENSKSKNQKIVENFYEKSYSDTPFYLKYRIPIVSSIYKVKNKFYSDNKKNFFIYTSLIILAALISVSLIVVGGLWLGGAFGENTIDSELGFIPGIIMAIGASILVVV